MYSDVSVGKLWPITTSLLNNQSSFSFSCETNNCPMQIYYLLIVILIKLFCSLIFVQIRIFFFLESTTTHKEIAKNTGMNFRFCKSSRWFWCRLGPPPRHLPSSFSPQKVWATFSTPLSVKVYILLGFIPYVLVDITCNWGFWDLCGFPAAKILLNLWIK